MTNDSVATLRAEVEPYFDALSAPTNVLRVVIADWGLAVLGAISLLVLTAGVAIVLSVAMATAALPGTVDLGRDAALGLGLLPSAFGAPSTVSVGHGSGFLGIQIACAAIPWMLYPAFAITLFMRFVSTRMADDRRRLIVFPVKFAALSAAAIAALSLALPKPPPTGQALDGFTVRTNSLAAAAGAFCIVTAVASYFVANRVWSFRMSRSQPTVGAAVRSAIGCGLGAVFAMIVAGAMIAVPAGVAASDTTHERVQFVSAVGAVGLNLGAEVGVVAFGGNLRVSEAAGTGANRLDLSHFGAPPDGRHNPESVRYLLLLVPLLALALGASRLARRNRTVRIGTLLVACLVFVTTFVLASGLLALFARLDVGGFAPEPSRSGRLLVGVDVSSMVVHALVASVVVAAVVGVASSIVRRRNAGAAGEGGGA